MQDTQDKTGSAPGHDVTADETMLFRNEEGDLNPAYLDAVTKAVEASETERLRLLLEDVHEADLGDLIEALAPEDRPRLIELLGKDFDFTALTEVDDAVREEILEELETATVAEGVRELDSDDAVTILESLDDENKAEVLDQLPALERVYLQRSLDYPEGSAGRRMQSEFIAVPPFWTVGQTIDYLREAAEDLPEAFYEIFVIDPAGHLLGAVALDRLLRSKRSVTIQDIMDNDPDRVEATQDQGEVARLFERYNLVSAAVVDDSNRLVGAMMVDDIVDVLEEEADADIKALGGVNSQEELSDSVLVIARGRFLWLFANLCTAILASLVIRVFQGSLEQMVALAILMPIVASMGGNAGTQTMTVVVRALATRELGRANTWRIICREGIVGLMNGVIFALIMGIFAVLWFQNADLGVVIGLALITVLFFAAIGGILVPLGLERMGVDPAVSSGPFVTTITDIVGFFSFLGIATLWFGF